MLHAHKCILSARSAVFLEMFSNDIEEKEEWRVELPDFDITVLTEMLRYIYTEEVHNIEQYSYDLLILADKYALGGLKHMCETYFCERFSHRHNYNKSQKQVINFIIANRRNKQ